MSINLMCIDEVRPLLLARAAAMVACLTGAIEDHLILPTFSGINVNELRGHKAVSFTELGRGQTLGSQMVEEATKNTLSVTLLFRKCKKKILIVIVGLNNNSSSSSLFGGLRATTLYPS